MVPCSAYDVTVRAPAGGLCVRAHHLLLSLLRIFWRPFSQALKTFGSDIGIAFSGAEDVALIEYAHLTGRPYRVFRLVAPPIPSSPPCMPAHARRQHLAPPALSGLASHPATRRYSSSAVRVQTRPPMLKPTHTQTTLTPIPN